MNDSSYYSLKEAKVEAHQEKRNKWFNLRNACLLLLAFLGGCMLFRQNTGKLPLEDTIRALINSKRSSLPIMDYPDCPGVHTWHTISAITGNWRGLVSATYENVTFADLNCKLSKNFFSFVTAPEYPVAFGMKLGSDATFDLTYSIAVVQAGNKFEKLIGPGRKCVWVSAAEGPAYPDVRDLPYNGATCLWERVDGVGENFQVDYWDPLF